MLVEEGKVKLGEPASRFIPSLKGLQVAIPQGGRSTTPGAALPRGEPVAAQREITVRDLLTHTSGLVRALPFGTPEALGRYVERLGSLSLDFQPGTRWAYSPQAGFDILARIVEIASGQTFDAFTRERLFRPLGMNDTFFDPANDPPRMVTLYRNTEDGLVRAANPGFMNGVHFSGAGGLMSTAEDYLQFAQVLANGGEWKGVRLLSPRSVDLMRSALVPSTTPGLGGGIGYGLGVRVLVDPATRNSLLSEGSFGWSGAFGTHFWVDPKEGIVAILMAQHQAPIPFLSEIEAEFETAVMQAFTPARR
jgi:CubicO group peptidase (beta-lactamase class C family)